MKRIDYELLGRKALEKYPYIAHQLIEYPILHDLDLIPDLWKYFKTNRSHTEQMDFLLFMVTVVKLYDPDAMDGWKPMKKGLRKKLSDVLNICPTQISHHLKSCREYLSIYKDFKEKVELLKEEFKFKI